MGEKMGKNQISIEIFVCMYILKFSQKFQILNDFSRKHAKIRREVS